MVTLFPPTHLEGDGRGCCGAISLEGAGECSVDLARARLRDRRSRTEGVEGVKLTTAPVILRLRSLAGARRTKLRSWRAAAGSRQMMPPQHQRAYPPVRRSFPSTSNCRHEPASIWNQEFEIRIVTTLPLKRCAWALSPPTASHLQGLILLERGDAQYVSHLFEDRELQQTAGINYYMRDIVHVIALFDQK